MYRVFISNCRKFARARAYVLDPKMAAAVRVHTKNVMVTLFLACMHAWFSQLH